MERSGSQKFLLVISIINIILAVFIILSGIAFNLAGGALGASSAANEVASQVTAETGVAVTGGQISFLVVAGGLLMLLDGIVRLVMGILGVRAANDNQKIMPVWVLALASLLISILGIVSNIINGQMGSPSAIGGAIGSIAFSILMFWVANNIKTQAGK